MQKIFVAFGAVIFLCSCSVYTITNKTGDDVQIIKSGGDHEIIKAGACIELTEYFVGLGGEFPFSFSSEKYSADHYDIVIKSSVIDFQSSDKNEKCSEEESSKQSEDKNEENNNNTVQQNPVTGTANSGINEPTYFIKNTHSEISVEVQLLLTDNSIQRKTLGPNICLLVTKDQIPKLSILMRGYFLCDSDAQSDPDPCPERHYNIKVELKNPSYSESATTNPLVPKFMFLTESQKESCSNQF